MTRKTTTKIKLVNVAPCKLICMQIHRGTNKLELGERGGGGEALARQDSIAAEQNVASNHNAGQMINAKLSGPLYAGHVCGNAQINCGRGRLRICSGPAAAAADDSDTLPPNTNIQTRARRDRVCVCVCVLLSQLICVS